MVPWHEAAEFSSLLQRCGVPHVCHLMYQYTEHHHFVTEWYLLPPAVRAAHAVQEQQLRAAGAPLPHHHPSLAYLTDFGRDVVRIALGQADGPVVQAEGRAQEHHPAGQRPHIVGLAMLSKL